MEDFNITQSSADRLTRQKTKTEAIEPIYTVDQMNAVNIYRTFHSTATGYICFSSLQGTYLRIDHVAHHQSSLSKVKQKALKSYHASFLITWV